MSNRVGWLIPTFVTLTTVSIHMSVNSGGPDNVIKGRFPEQGPSRCDIFVSYCQKDQHYWNELSKFLENLRRQGIDIYAYDMVEPGAKIRDKARSALMASAVAVLLISQDYIASDLMDHELPDLLYQVEQGTLMLTLHVGVFDEYGLGGITQYQRVGARFKPLNKLKKPDREEVYLELVKAIRNRLIERDRHPDP